MSCYWKPRALMGSPIPTDPKWGRDVFYDNHVGPPVNTQTRFTIEGVLIQAARFFGI